MTRRIESGDRCLIVGCDKGCEPNVGAQLTVTLYDLEEKDGLLRWQFKNATRPLIVRSTANNELYWDYEVDRSRYIIHVRDSFLIKLPPENPVQKVSFRRTEHVL